MILVAREFSRRHGSAVGGASFSLTHCPAMAGENLHITSRIVLVLHVIGVE